MQSMGSGGSLLGGIGNYIGQGDAVKGTGQTVGDLTKIGYSPDEIAQLGTSPSMGHRGFNAAMGGLRGLSNRQQPQQQGGYSPIQIPQAPQVSSDYFSPNRLGMAQGPRPNSLFFGGSL